MAELEKAPTVVGLALIAAVVVTGFTALATGLASSDPNAYSIAEAARPSPTSWIYLTVVDQGEIHPISIAAKAVRLAEVVALLGVGAMGLFFNALG